MSFENNLIKLRKQKGWSQDELAENLDLSRQAISKWENGTSKPDIDNIKRISKVFDVGIDELLSNDITDDHALSLDFDSNKKKKKSDKGILLVKCIIFALVIIYVISVIYKLVALLIIVNGVEKYQNLSNYHYIITTYNENGLSQKEECWFKDGESKTINIFFSDVDTSEVITYINYNKKYAYVEQNSIKTEINFEEYLNFYKDYMNGGQLYDNLPNMIRKKDLYSNLLQIFYFGKIKIDVFKKGIVFKVGDCYINLDKETLLPEAVFSEENNFINIYSFNLNSVEIN